jgi:hypothetical protein
VAENQTPVVTEDQWDDIAGTSVERLRTPKPVAVPAPIVKQAQASYDEKAFKEFAFVNADGTPNPERAASFAKHLKNAGLHTTPLTSVAVAIDPDNNGSTHVVSWRAGERRGRK